MPKNIPSLKPKELIFNISILEINSVLIYFLNT